MRSLRARLILGAGLVAIVPLALSMFLLSRRIETTVRTEAADRMSTALGGLDQDLRADGARLTDRLLLLSRDPELRRLYLVRASGSRDLSIYLAQRRFLLGLDFLQVADTSGALVSNGSWSAGDSARVSVAPPRGAVPLRLRPMEGGPGLALAATAPILYERSVAGLLDGGTALDAAFLGRLRRSGGMELTLRDAAGRLVATTLGGPARDAAALRPGPDAADTTVARVAIGGRSFLSRSVRIEIGVPPYATVTGLVPTESSDRTIAALRVTSLALGGAGLGIAILLGFLWSAQISRPVERLAAFSDRVAQGEWDEPLALESVRELETLAEALDRMRRDLLAYRERLVVSERQAAWSQMARRVAHEIKNPLTPIAVSVADLRRSYEQKRDDFPAILDQAVRTIGEEVATMKRLLSEFAEFARMPAPVLAPVRVADLFADLGALYAADVAAGRLAVRSAARDVVLEADGGQIRQALVNLVQNGLDATRGGGHVTVEAATEPDAVLLLVADDGPGLTEEAKASLFLPGFTTKAEGSGLGLTIVERIVNDHGGSIRVDSRPGGGTRFRIRLPRPGRT
ncbi:MAG: ATP-binding protein [Hyphomicrobiales bacterium]